MVQKYLVVQSDEIDTPYKTKKAVNYTLHAGGWGSLAVRCYYCVRVCTFSHCFPSQV